MAWPFTPRKRVPQALTGSVSTVPVDKDRLRLAKSKDAGWQKEAWGFFHDLGEVRFAARYYGNALARVRFFVGTRENPGDPVVQIPDDAKGDDLLVRDVLNRIKGRDGTFQSLVRVYGQNHFIAGECFLVGEDGLEGERWEFLSTSELRRIDNNSRALGTVGSDPSDVYERDKGNNEKVVINPDESLVLRFWSRDPEFRERADSPMRAVLDICIAEGTMVSTARGPVPIEEVEPGDDVWGWLNGSRELARVTATADNGIRDVVTLRTRNHAVTMTPDHRVLVFDPDRGQGAGRKARPTIGWKRADEIQPGEFVVWANAAEADAERCTLSDGTVVDESVAWLLGFTTGDGHVAKYSLHLATAADETAWRRCAEILDEVWGLKLGRCREGDNFCRVHSLRLCDAFRDAGLGRGSSDRTIPKVVLRSSEKVQRAYIEGYQAADAHWAAPRNRWAYAATSPRLIGELRALHQSLGDRTSNVHVEERHPLHVAGSTRRTEHPKALHRFDVYSGARTGRFYLTGRRARDLVGDDFAINRVVSVESAGRGRVFDLTVPATQNFLADGLVVHNCEALHTAQQMQTAGDKSRLASGGIYFVPAEADLPKAPAADNSGSVAQAPRLMLMDSINTAMTTAMENPGSVGAISPILVEVKSDYIEKFKHETFAREVDKTIVARIDHLIRRYAQGVDLPPEVLLGMADINHWSGWLVSEQTVHAHISPAAAEFCEDLDVGFVRPTIETLKVKDPERYAMGYDVSDLVTSPDRAEHAVTLYSLFLLGGDHLLETLGFDPSQQPDMKELIHRILLIRASNPRNPNPGADIAALEGKAPPPTEAEKPVPGDPSAPVQPEVSETGPNQAPAGKPAPGQPNAEQTPVPEPPANGKADANAKDGKPAPKGGRGAKTPGSAKKPPPKAKQPKGSKASYVDEMTFAIDYAIDEALNADAGAAAVADPGSWIRLRDTLARHVDLDVLDALMQGVITLARMAQAAPGTDVVAAAQILCEAALFDPDDLDEDGEIVDLVTT